MGTFVTMQIVRPDQDMGPGGPSPDAVLDRAFAWFGEVERRCSRFDPASELRGLLDRVGDDVPVSEMLFGAVQFAMAVAEDTGGAFDPTVGAGMERRGFNRHYATGAEISTPARGTVVSYRDVRLDARARTITLRRPLVLDLGAVAKGLAIDMAAQELRPFRHFAVDAGGDLYLAGDGPSGHGWAIGVRHPREDSLLTTVQVSDAAVCTSGDYEQPGSGEGHHVIDGRTHGTAAQAISATVIAPTALAADALATAAFVLGPADGIALLERHGVSGLIVSPQLDRSTTKDFGRYA